VWQGLETVPNAQFGCYHTYFRVHSHEEPDPYAVTVAHRSWLKTTYPGSFYLAFPGE